MNSTYVKSNVPAFVTAAGALLVIALGVSSASAGEGSLKSVETAPAITCAAGTAVDDVKVFNATEFVGTDAIAIVNGYVAKTAGWTNENYNPAVTSAETLTLGKTALTQVDVRDFAMRRIASFVVSPGIDGNSYLSRAFTCASPVVPLAPGFAVNSSNAA